jgi:hypothetical protein
MNTSMNAASLQATVPRPVFAKLEMIRRRTMWLHVAAALIAAAAVLLAGMAMAMLIDWLATLYDSRIRFLLTGAALTAAVVAACGWLYVARRRALAWRQLAHDVEEHIPQLQERWTTMIGLRPADATNPQQIHPAMLRRVGVEAARWESKVAPQEVVSLSPLLKNLIALTAMTAVLGIAAVVDSHQTLVLLERFWRPGQPISATELVDVTGDLAVGQGEPATLKATVRGTAVSTATLFIEPGGDDQGDAIQEIALAARGDSGMDFSHSIRAVEQPFRYRLRAGDGQTSWYSVRVAERPEIAELRLTVTPPAYDKRPATTVDGVPWRVTALEQSQLEVAVRPRQAIRKAHVRIEGDRETDAQSMQMAADADGWYRWRVTLEKSFVFSPELVEEHGLTNRRAPKCVITVRADAPPSVKLVTPNDDVIVRPDDTIEIEMQATDDVGVVAAELLVYDESNADPNKEPLARIPIALGEQKGATSLKKSVSLDLSKFQMADGAELSYEVRVRDGRGEFSSSSPPAPGEKAPGAAESPTNLANDQSESASPTNDESPSETQTASSSNPNEVQSQTQPQQPTANQTAASSQQNGRPTPSNSPSQSSQGGMSPPTEEQQPPSESSSSNSKTPSTRSLDVPQYATSSRQTIKVDEWAGSFEGQQRAKLEIAVAPELDALDKHLERAQSAARGVLDKVEQKVAWSSEHDRGTITAQQATTAGLKVIAALQKRTKDTPYAFVGLQAADLGIAHVEPARELLWSATKTDGAGRVDAIQQAWQHLTRARELLKDLRGQFERSKREFQLAETVEKVKKMYQVYLENSQALLETSESDPSRYNRKMAELEMDDEYLERLREVLEMRNRLRAELARILGDDPRLLRRFMDLLRNRAANLREQLADLTAKQDELNREVQAWAAVSEVDRPRIARLLLVRQVQDAAALSDAASELESSYQTWLPLDRKAEDADLNAATATVRQVAATAGQLSLDAEQFVVESQRVRMAVPAPQPPVDGASDGSAAPATPDQAEVAEAPWDAAEAAGTVLQQGQSLYNDLAKAEVALRQMAAREDNDEIAQFAINRLVETRRLTADVSAWVRQIQAHVANAYTRAAEVDQYRLANKTEELAGKLGDIEQTLAALMQQEDGKVPEPIAIKAREFMRLLDREASPNQIAAVFALRSSNAPQAVERQTRAGMALTAAEKTFDEMVRLAIAEMDKLPVQDPVTQLLDDPTLDELLAQLEQEVDLQELLGIPDRPSNLQIIGDWTRPGNMPGGRGMVQRQMRSQDARNRRKLDEAYQRALARALNESTARRLEEPVATKMTHWNRLLSTLGDDLRQGRDKAPPEQYRRAIEQYFDLISRDVPANAGQ